MNQDLHNNVKEVNALNGVTMNSAATFNGNIIDTQFYNALEFVIQLGAYSAGVATPQIQEADLADFSDATVTDPDFILGSTATAAAALNGANKTARLGYVGKKRYVRLNIIASSTPNFYLSAIGVFGHPHSAPTVS